jgi:hypothetical protein
VQPVGGAELERAPGSRNERARGEGGAGVQAEHESRQQPQKR